VQAGERGACAVDRDCKEPLHCVEKLCTDPYKGKKAVEVWKKTSEPVPTPRAPTGVVPQP
jgi:hypothetical protein